MKKGSLQIKGWRRLSKTTYSGPDPYPPTSLRRRHVGNLSSDPDLGLLELGLGAWNNAGYEAPPYRTYGTQSLVATILPSFADHGLDNGEASEHAWLRLSAHGRS
jgi:hypothetical protein